MDICIEEFFNSYSFRRVLGVFADLLQPNKQFHWWDPENENRGWGYGGKSMRPQSKDEFIERYRGLVTAMLENKGISAFCYTQLTDVEQEVNGLYTYDRRPKFDVDVIRAINTQIAAIEEA